MANTTGYGYLLGPAPQFFDANGKPLVGGKLFVYIAGTTTKAVTYSDFYKTENTNPVVLNDLGTCMLIVQSANLYKIVLYDRKGNLLLTRDNVRVSSEKQIIYSSDSTVDVTATTDTDTGIITYDLSIQKEIDRATEAEKGLADAIDAEKNRAESAEIALSKSIADKAGTASPLMDGKASVGNSLKYAREDHVHPSDTSREDIANKTTVVLGTSDSKYPTDKAVAEFVNSSIATNTANYISNNGEPFTSVEQLEAYSGPVTNNDYAFVTGIDSEGNTYYDRYKATVSVSTVTWALEYRLNNSSFTAAQWSAINSGITSVLVAKIHDHSNKDVLDGITSDKVNSWDGKEDAFKVLPTTKGGTGTNAASKSALTSTLINSLSAETSTPKDADYYVSQFAGGGTTTTSYHRRPVSALWDYIKGKISSVLRLTASDYAGKAATAGTADKAVADKSGNDIETTYATKSELSTHKGDTTVHITAAERTAWNAKQAALTAGDNVTIANNVISSNQVFEATYGTTTYQEIKDAYDAGKICLCKRTSGTPRVFYLRYVSDSDIGFTTGITSGDYYHYAYVTSSNSWGAGYVPLQKKLTFDKTPTAGSNNPVTSGGVKTAIDKVDSKGIVINEIDGENVIFFE